MTWADHRDHSWILTVFSLTDTHMQIQTSSSFPPRTPVQLSVLWNAYNSTSLKHTHAHTQVPYFHSDFWNVKWGLTEASDQGALVWYSKMFVLYQLLFCSGGMHFFNTTFPFYKCNLEIQYTIKYRNITVHNKVQLWFLFSFCCFPPLPLFCAIARVLNYKHTTHCVFLLESN